MGVSGGRSSGARVVGMLLLLAAVCGVVGVVPAFASAATLYASPSGGGSAPCTDSSDRCPLPAAITEANGDSGDTIDLAAGDYGAPVGGFAALTSDQTWAGAGQGSGGTDLVGQSGMTAALLTVGGSNTVTLEDLEISGATYGGVFNESGTLVVTDDTFAGNQSPPSTNPGPPGISTYGNGGAIDNADRQYGTGGGVLTVTGSTFTDNTAASDGGAISSGFLESGTLTVSDSTFSGNTAPGGDGGAISADADAFGGSGGTASVSGSTFSDDNAMNGGALDLADSSTAEMTATVADSTFSDDADSQFGVAILNGFAGRDGLSVVASTFSGGGIANGEGSGSGSVAVAGDLFATGCSQAGGSWVDDGDNAGIDTSCMHGGSGDVTGSSVSSDLGVLADNGGPTQTAQIEAGNPGIGIVSDRSVTDAAGDSVQLCPTVDQRGVASRSGALCDAGAVQGTLVPVDVTGSQSYGSGSPSFPYSALVPNGYSLQGAVACSTVDAGTQISATLAPGDYTIDAGSCSGLSLSPSGSDYTLQYAGGDLAVAQADQAPVVSGPAGEVPFGSSVSLSASVAPAGSGVPPTGSVTFYAGSTDLGTASLSGAVATLQGVSDLPVGSDAISASYSGDGKYLTESSISTATVTVVQATPAVGLSVAPMSGASVSRPVTLTASVVGVAAAAPTGSVMFTVANDPGAGCTGVVLDNGTASCSLGALPAGTYSFTASYNGDQNYDAGDQSVASYVVSTLPVSVSAGTAQASVMWFGQPDTLSVTVTSGGQPVSGGTVQFSSGGQSLGSPVSVGTSGTATLQGVSGLPVGSDQITATYSGTPTYASGTWSGSLVVAQAATTTTAGVTPGSVYAVIAPVSPGAGSPSGSVSFGVDGQTLGNAEVVNGTATLSYTVPAGKTHQVAAVYSGDDDFTGSSGSVSRRDPVITATITSARPVSRYGWYLTPVTITFHCTTNGAALAGACPAAVALSHSGAAQSVTRTITALDGGAASVTFSPINIDLGAPRVAITGARNAAVYDAPGPKVACHTKASLSGVTGRCRLEITRKSTPGGLTATVAYTATVAARNGITTTIRGHYTLRRVFIAGLAMSHGRWVLDHGREYLLEVYSTTQPYYLYAAPDGTTPGPHPVPMARIGHELWAIQIGVARAPSHAWNIAIQIGGHTTTIPITLE